VILLIGLYLAVRPPQFMLLSGGLLFGAVYMATDPVTSPLAPKGAYLFGFGIGALVVLIRVWGACRRGHVRGLADERGDAAPGAGDAASRLRAYAGEGEGLRRKNVGLVRASERLRLVRRRGLEMPGGAFFSGAPFILARSSRFV